MQHTSYSQCECYNAQEMYDDDCPIHNKAAFREEILCRLSIDPTNKDLKLRIRNTITLCMEAYKQDPTNKHYKRIVHELTTPIES